MFHYSKTPTLGFRSCLYYAENEDRVVETDDTGSASFLARQDCRQRAVFAWLVDLRGNTRYSVLELDFKDIIFYS